MNIETAGLLATSALSSAGLFVTALEGRRQRRLMRVQFANQSMDRYMTFQDRFYGLLGAPADRIQPPEWRKLLVQFFNFYAHLFLAHRVRVFPREHWEDLRVSLAYWVRRPEIREAWAEFGRQADEWPAGFVAFVNAELSDVASYAESTWENRPPNPQAWERLRDDLGP
jgi:hypothetical protein